MMKEITVTGFVFSFIFRISLVILFICHFDKGIAMIALERIGENYGGKKLRIMSA